MTDHRAFAQGLPDKVRADLAETGNRDGLYHLAGHLGLILVTGALIWLRVPGWWALLPIHGVLLTFLFTLEHECTHKTPFRAAWLNEGAGRIAGLVLILPFEWFRYFHLAHHRWTNIPGKDPELDAPKPETRRQWLWHVSGIPYWRSQIALLPGLAFGRVDVPYLPQGAMPRIRAEARAMLAAYAVLGLTLFRSDALLWLWVVPMLAGQPALRLYLLAEHGDCPQVASMFENTRTTFTNRAVRFLAWNMPYHVEHHVMPQVP
ncbi:MAG: hypothetical protein RLZZ528_1703, partial [Pseudomonadota bacterium]